MEDRELDWVGASHRKVAVAGVSTSPPVQRAACGHLPGGGGRVLLSKGHGLFFQFLGLGMGLDPRRKPGGVLSMQGLFISVDPGQNS